jgi:hypothetical protein
MRKAAGRPLFLCYGFMPIVKPFELFIKNANKGFYSSPEALGLGGRSPLCL